MAVSDGMNAPQSPLESVLERQLKDAGVPFISRQYLHEAAEEEYLANRELSAALGRALLPGLPPEERPSSDELAPLLNEYGRRSGGLHGRIASATAGMLAASMFPKGWGEGALPLIGRESRANSAKFHLDYKANPLEEDYARLRTLNSPAEFASEIDRLIGGGRIAYEFLLIERRRDFYVASTYAGGTFRLVDESLASARGLKFFKDLDGKAIEPDAVAKRYAEFFRQ